MTGLIPYFDGILISSDEGCMKPDPEFYNICCERYHLQKSESVMIGNELMSDMAGAKAAGIDGFFINRCPVFHAPKEPIYKYVSKNGSLFGSTCTNTSLNTLNLEKKMIVREELLSLNFVRREDFSGSHKGMRFLLHYEAENEEKKLKVYIWSEPFGF